MGQKSFLTFLALMLAFSGNKPLKAETPDCCAAVKSQLEMGNITRAESLLEPLIQKKPCIAEALALKGRILANKDGLKEALVFYDKALKCGSLPRENILEIATAYSLTERHREAAKLLEDFLNKNPGDSEFLHELGLTYLALSELQKAQEKLEQGYKIAPENAAIAADYALSLIYNGSPDKAITLLEKAAREHPESAAVFMALGNARTISGKAGAAIEAYSKALENDANYSQARYHRARLYQQSGDFVKAEADFKILLKSELQVKALLGLIESALAAARPQDAQKWLRAAAKNEILPPEEINIYQAEIYRLNGDNKKAKELLLPLVEKEPKAQLAWKVLLAIAEEENDPILKERALKALKKPASAK